MEKVTGIGGVFFRAKDPSVLQSWYAKHLGVEPPQTYEGTVWHQEAGPTAAKVGAENSRIGTHQMYPNTGGKAITTMAAHAA